MTTVDVVLVVLNLVTIAACAWVLWTAPPRTETIIREVAPPAPLQIVPRPPAPQQEPMIHIRYVSTSGRVVGEEHILQRNRRSTRAHGRGVYAASEQLPDGTWVYRYTHQV